jgi:hypothetical protein
MLSEWSQDRDWRKPIVDLTRNITHYWSGRQGAIWIEQIGRRVDFRILFKAASITSSACGHQTPIRQQQGRTMIFPTARHTRDCDNNVRI